MLLYNLPTGLFYQFCERRIQMKLSILKSVILVCHDGPTNGGIVYKI